MWGASEEASYFLSSAGNVLEIADGLADIGDIGEGAGEAAEDLLKTDDLVAVHHAHQQILGPLGVHALGVQHRNAVVQLPQQLGRKLFRLLSDHLEFQRPLAAFTLPVAGVFSI